MGPEEFRRAGYALIDWIADYRRELETRPVLAGVGPGEIVGRYSVEPPADTVDIDQLLAELDSVIVPGVTQVQHPMHFGWFPSNASLSSVLGDLASSGLGSLGISWESSPALTEVEQVVCDWMRRLCGLSDRWHGTIQDTASTACLVALLSARERATDHSQTTTGLGGVDRAPVVYCTAQAHSSVRKAALLAGFGADHLRLVDTDPDTWAMSPDHLADLVAADVAAGLAPAAIVATVGTTGTTAVDPVDDIAAVAEVNGIWLHVDAAMAGAAMLLAEKRELFAGVERADSLCWNPHKWMGTILDTSLYYVADPEHLVRVMSTNPSYLQSQADGAVVQYRDWGIPLGRRFRSLKLLFHLRLDGVESIRARLRRDLTNARWLADQVAADDQWEVVAPVPFQTVCVRHRPHRADGTPYDPEVLDDHNRRWADAVNRSGQAYLTTSLLGDRWIVRVSIGVESTEAQHVEALWDLMRATASDLAGELGS